MDELEFSSWKKEIGENKKERIWWNGVSTMHMTHQQKGLAGKPSPQHVFSILNGV